MTMSASLLGRICGRFNFETRQEIISVSKESKRGLVIVGLTVAAINCARGIPDMRRVRGTRRTGNLGEFI